MINLNKIKKKLLIKIKKNERFEIKKEAVLKNNYYENNNFEIKFSKIKKKDRELIRKFLVLSKKIHGYQYFLNWGGGNGILDIFIKTINPSIETVIVEKKKLIEHIKSKPNLSKKYKYKKISFSTDQDLLKSDKFNMILFFGSLCYMQGIYDFFEKSKTKHIGISRLPMITNSTEDFIAFDNFGDHYEYFMSYEKFKKILSKNFNFLYFNEHWGGLKKNKQKIQNFKIKSFDILLERTS